MKAVVHDKYGPPEVLRLEEVERPTPMGDEVLIKVHATTVNRTDCAFLRARPFLLYRFITGFRRPRRRILGNELAGEVEAVGVAVSEFAVGDHVFGSTGLKFGTHAEFVCVRASTSLAHMPPGAGFDEAAAICDGAINAMTSLRRVGLRAGQRILVYGASGSIGTAAVQMAKVFNAEVTAVCSTKNLELMSSLGADRVMDYTSTDFAKSGERYDVIFDAVGKLSFARSRGSLRPGGTYIATDNLWNFPLALITRFAKKRVLFPVPKLTKENVQHVKELVEAGTYRAVIDRRYAMEQVVEAFRYVETAQKIGNVVLNVVDNRPA